MTWTAQSWHTTIFSEKRQRIKASVTHKNKKSVSPLWVKIEFWQNISFKTMLVCRHKCSACPVLIKRNICFVHLYDTKILVDKKNFYHVLSFSLPFSGQQHARKYLIPMDGSYSAIWRQKNKPIQLRALGPPAGLSRRTLWLAEHLSVRFCGEQC